MAGNALRSASAEPARVATLRGRRPADAVELDRLIHGRARLAIVSALAAKQSLTFSELREIVGATDGNLSVHARKLEAACYLECLKSFHGRVPRTEFRLTARGRRALDRYLDHMEALIRATREAGRRAKKQEGR